MADYPDPALEESVLLVRDAVATATARLEDLAGQRPPSGYASSADVAAVRAAVEAGGGPVEVSNFPADLARSADVAAVRAAVEAGGGPVEVSNFPPALARSADVLAVRDAVEAIPPAAPVDFPATLARTADVLAVRDAVEAIPPAAFDTAGLALDATVDRAADSLDALVTYNDAVEGLLAAIRDRAALPDITVSDQVTGAGWALVLNVPAGYKSFSLHQNATGGSASYSLDWFDGTLWYPLYGRTQIGSTLGVSTGQTNPNSWQAVGGIPPGAVSIRIRCSAWTSGAPIFALTASPAPIDPVVGIMGGSVTIAGNPILGSGNSQIGAARSSAFWGDDSAVALAANGVFTGVSRDHTGTPTQGGFVNGAAYGHAEVRGQAISDQFGNLCLEVSRDGVTWRRVRTVAASNVGTDVSAAAGTVWVAELAAKPSSRFSRLVYVNGGVAQGYFHLNSMLLSG